MGELAALKVARRTGLEAAPSVRLVEDKANRQHSIPGQSAATVDPGCSPGYSPGCSPGYNPVAHTAVVEDSHLVEAGKVSLSRRQ